MKSDLPLLNCLGSGMTYLKMTINYWGKIA